MSIKPEYIKKMENGEKVVEIRKKFNPRWKGCRVTLYSSTPTQALYGYAVIKKIDRGSPDYIWEKYKKDIGSDRDNFVKYANNSNRVYAIHLDNYETYLSPLFLEQISHLTKKDLKPPQSYFSLENNSDWAQAVTIAELLHGRFQIYSSVI